MRWPRQILLLLLLLLLLLQLIINYYHNFINILSFSLSFFVVNLIIIIIGLGKEKAVYGPQVHIGLQESHQSTPAQT